MAERLSSGSASLRLFRLTSLFTHDRHRLLPHNVLEVSNPERCLRGGRQLLLRAAATPLRSGHLSGASEKLPVKWQWKLGPHDPPVLAPNRREICSQGARATFALPDTPGCGRQLFYGTAATSLGCAHTSGVS